MTDAHYTFLALGDSYTIGEAVEESQRWPNQLKLILHGRGIILNEIEIIAKTGWTTDELKIAIAEKGLTGKYDYVSLLIGVNNQYRGYPLDTYKKEFEELLITAINYAAGLSQNVIVLSIPDWGAMPFAEGKDRTAIASEIDAFNAANLKICLSYKVHYVDVTPISRMAPEDALLVASDGLHPSGKMYKMWADQVALLF